MTRPSSGGFSGGDVVDLLPEKGFHNDALLQGPCCQS